MNINYMIIEQWKCKAKTNTPILSITPKKDTPVKFTQAEITERP